MATSSLASDFSTNNHPLWKDTVASSADLETKGAVERRGSTAKGFLLKYCLDAPL